MEIERQMDQNVVPLRTIRQQMEAFHTEWQELLGDTGGKLARELNLLVDVILTEQEEMILEKPTVSLELMIAFTEIAIEQCTEEKSDVFRRLSLIDPNEPAKGVALLRQYASLSREVRSLRKGRDVMKTNLDKDQISTSEDSST